MLPRGLLVPCLLLLVAGGDTTPDGESAAEVNLGNRLHSLLREKMEETRQIILHGHSTAKIPPLDPFHLDSLSLMIQEPKGFVNVSLKKVTVRGLSDFEVKDVASNFDLMRTSILLYYPELHINSLYRIKGFLNPPFSQYLNDAGKFEATVKRAGAAWSGQVTGDGPEDVTFSQTSFRTFFNDVTEKTVSFLKKRPMAKSMDLLKAVSSAVVEKIQRVLEDNLSDAIAQVMGKGQSFQDMWPVPLLRPQEDDGDEGGEGHHRHSIQKRQVPCENGEGLDEYVDTLLRFGRRLIRFMEPIRFPNTTIKIDDQLLVFLYNGGARGASTLSRKRPAYVRCTNTSITLGLVIGFEQLMVTASYRVLQDYRLLLFNGEADIKVTDTVVLVQITQFMNGETRQQLDKLKIWKLGHVQVRMRGLGSVTSAMSMLISYAINEDPNLVIPVAEAQLKQQIREQLSNVTIPIFSII